MYVCEGKKGLLDIQSVLTSLIFGPTCNWKMSSIFQTKDAVAKKGLFKQKSKNSLDSEMGYLETQG